MVPLVERAAADRYDPQPIFLVLFISRPGSMCFIQAPSMWWKRDMTVPDFKAGFTALNRFGFGARGDGDLAAAASDPRGFLKAELAQPGIALLEGPGMPRTAQALQAMFADEDLKKADRARMAAAAQPAMPPRQPWPPIPIPRSRHHHPRKLRTWGRRSRPRRSSSSIAPRRSPAFSARRRRVPASSRGWWLFGRTISASRWRRAISSGSAQALSNAKRSVRMCLPVSPT